MMRFIEGTEINGTVNGKLIEGSIINIENTDQVYDSISENFYLLEDIEDQTILQPGGAYKLREADEKGEIIDSVSKNAQKGILLANDNNLEKSKSAVENSPEIKTISTNLGQNPDQFKQDVINDITEEGLTSISNEVSAGKVMAAMGKLTQSVNDPYLLRAIQRRVVQGQIPIKFYEDLVQRQVIKNIVEENKQNGDYQESMKKLLETGIDKKIAVALLNEKIRGKLESMKYTGKLNESLTKVETNEDAYQQQHSLLVQ